LGAWRAPCRKGRWGWTTRGLQPAGAAGLPTKGLSSHAEDPKAEVARGCSSAAARSAAGAAALQQQRLHEAAEMQQPAGTEVRSRKRARGRPPKVVQGEHPNRPTVAEVAAQGSWQIATMTAYSLTPYASDFSAGLITPELRCVRLGCGQEVTVVGMGDVTVRGTAGSLPSQRCT